MRVSQLVLRGMLGLFGRISLPDEDTVLILG